MSNIGFVYCWVNIINLKWYIGSHRGDPSDGYVGSGKIFKMAINKYGIENFKRIILYTGAEYKEHEEEFFQLLEARSDNRSYNLQDCYRGGSMKGRNHTEETKAKMSASKKNTHTGSDHHNFGKKASEETREKMRLVRKGKNTGESHHPYNKVVSQEFKEKMSLLTKGENNGMYGGTHSEETRRKISEKAKGRAHTEETKLKIKESHKTQPRIVCPHCNKEGKIYTMQKYHFDNCKMKE